jgi:hypothetical protein
MLDVTFDKIDLDGNGTLDSDEVQAASRELGLPYSKEQLNLVFQLMDKEKTGEISRPHFIEYMLGGRKDTGFGHYEFSDGACPLTRGPVALLLCRHRRRRVCSVRPTSLLLTRQCAVRPRPITAAPSHCPVPVTPRRRPLSLRCTDRSTPCPKAPLTKASGTTATCTAQAPANTPPPSQSTRASGWTTKGKARGACSSGTAGRCTRGRTARGRCTARWVVSGRAPCGRGQGGVCSSPLTAECTPHPPPSQGTYTWKDGSYYCGEFSHDKQHGAGTYYHAKVRALAPPCPGPLTVALSWPCFKRASALPLPSLCPPFALPLPSLCPPFALPCPPSALPLPSLCPPFALPLPSLCPPSALPLPRCAS